MIGKARIASPAPPPGRDAQPPLDVMPPRGRRRLGLAAAALALAAGSAAWCVPRIGTTLVVQESIGEPDAIVTLASHEWERLPKAVALAKAFPRARVLLTLPSQVTVYNCHDCGRRVERLVRAGVESERIRVLGLTDTGTRGEALSVLRFTAREGVRRLLVVTSPYHTRRALLVFRYVLRGSGIQVGSVAAQDPQVDLHPEHWWRSPNDRAYVGYEWAGLFYYWLRFGVPMTT